MPTWVGALVIGGTFGLLLWLELRRPLRRQVESKLTRTARNLIVAGLGAVAVQLAERPLVEPIAALVKRRRWGLLQRAMLPQWLEIPLALLLLDYTLYIWHVLVHRVPWLWRFHLVHHVDLDLDASTALRFHFGELTVSVPWRAAQIMMIGVSPFALSVWQLTLLVSILFHHSNIDLPSGVERHMSRFIVTPRMHGIHHSMIKEETESNWSSGLAVWDWLHGTLRLGVPQTRIRIGVPAYSDPKDVELPKI
ncbi:MAG: sterol desaturase family protein, partial [Acidimicrobiia bacterium]